MASSVRYEDVTVGQEIGLVDYPVRRVDLVKYCGASGDFNVLHWNERRAKAAGLPDVIAHGMFTMGRSVRLVTDWLGDPGAVVDYEVRFSQPVVVPDTDEGVELRVGGVIEDKWDGDRVAVALSVSAGGGEVLSVARVVARLC